MAADGQACAGRERTSNRQRKIVRAGRWLIGSSGATLLLEVLKHAAEDIGSASTAWEISRKIRAIFGQEGITGVADPDGGGNLYNGDFLVASADGCWSLFKDLGSCWQDRPCSSGSGGAFGAGALEAFLRMGLAPEDALRKAVEVAIYFDTGSGGEIQVEVTG